MGEVGGIGGRKIETTVLEQQQKNSISSWCLFLKSILFNIIQLKLNICLNSPILSFDNLLLLYPHNNLFINCYLPQCTITNYSMFFVTKCNIYVCLSHNIIGSLRIKLLF